MRRFVRSTLHPERYHGHRKSPPFFEGWYYKIIDADERHKFAVIPGIFKNAAAEKTHAFIQVLDGVAGTSAYHTFPVEAFSAAEDNFDVHIGPNRFRAEGITLNLEGSDLALRGELRFEGRAPWPVTLTAPGIMGWYAWMPFMECYHGVVSLDHTIQGSVTRDGAAMDFGGGRGYIEKDWGVAFPAAWIWTQTNHFAAPGTCLTASVAMIPWIGRAFRGFIIGLWHEGRLYRFATYTNAQIEKLELTDDHVTWVVRDRGHRLEMLASRTAGGLLHGPTRHEMHQRVEETLNATVEVCLSAFEGGTPRRRFQGVGRNAGLEVEGDLPRLLKG
jgi:tocopherol cyclase